MDLNKVTDHLNSEIEKIRELRKDQPLPSVNVILDHLNTSVEKVFDFTVGELKRVKTTCDEAIALMESKRNDLLIAHVQYIRAVDAVSKSVEDMQRRISVAIVASDAIAAPVSDGPADGISGGADDLFVPDSSEHTGT